MRHYELMLVLNPEADDEQLENFKGRVRTFVADRGGEIASEEEWGRRQMAYQVGKYKEGNYLLAHLSLEPAPAKELERILNMLEDVIRHLLVKQE